MLMRLTQRFIGAMLYVFRRVSRRATLALARSAYPNCFPYRCAYCGIATAMPPHDRWPSYCADPRCIDALADAEPLDEQVSLSQAWHVKNRRRIELTQKDLAQGLCDKERQELQILKDDVHAILRVAFPQPDMQKILDLISKGIS